MGIDVTVEAGGGVTVDPGTGDELALTVPAGGTIDLAPTTGGGPALSDADPQPPGAADPGSSGAASRADHVHAPPSAGQIGALTEAGGDARYDALGAAAAITTSSIGAVPTSRTVNGHALTGDVTLTAADVGADAAGAAASAQSASQPLDSDLTAIAALSTTSYGRGLLSLADAAAALSAIGAASSSHTHDTIGSFTLDVRHTVAASPVSPMTNQGTAVVSMTTSHPYLSSTSNTVNDGRTWEFVRGSGGTYKVTFWYWGLTNGGVATVYVDGNVLGTVDMYAGSNVGGLSSVVATGLALSAGWHTYGWKITSKNGSSSSYSYRIYDPTFTRRP